MPGGSRGRNVTDPTDAPPMSGQVLPALYRTAAPHPALRPHVQAYVQIADHPDGTIQVAALPVPMLLVTWGAEVQILTSPAGTRSLPHVVLAGPTSRVHHSAIGAGAHGFHVRFTPTGARALLGERATPQGWDDGLPAAVERWSEAVTEAASFEARVALADAFWLSRRPDGDLWTSAAAALLTRTAGAVPVTAVADALGVSERTLRRRFADDVGLGVKEFAQVQRYRQAHGFLLRTPGATWRDACERFGYADQAHFVRAFQRFTGQPPTRWRLDERRFDLSFGLRDGGSPSTRKTVHR